MKILKRKTLAALLALSLLASLLPLGAQPAQAAENAPQTLYVGNYQITNGNAKTYLKAGSTQGSLVEGSENDWTVKYDRSTATLTLNGATIQGGTSTGSVPYGAGIYALCSEGQPVALTIELIGTNTITGYHGIFLNAEIDASSYGTNATLTITGENNGSLKVSGSNHGIYVKSGTGNASLNIEKATVTSSTNGNSAAGVYVMSSSTATNSPQLSLAVNGGSLTASGGESSDGIWFYVGSSQAIGATTSLTVSENAIVDARNGGIKASDSSMSDLSDRINVSSSGDGNNGGIVWNGKDGTVYGEVELQDELTIGSGETLTIGKDASLTVPDGTTLTNNGTVTTTDGGSLTNQGTINNSGTLPSDIDGNEPPSITTTSLADGTVNTVYSATLEASGNPTSWEITDGSLPDGLTLAENTGVISGNPTTSGTSTFTVKAINNGGSDSKQLSIIIKAQTNIPVTGVSLNKASTTLTVGDTETLTATVAPEDATNKAVTWSSNDSTVATVDESGKVTAIAPGEATITVTTADGNHAATCTVIVHTATTITTQPQSVSVTEGQSATFSVTATGDNLRYQWQINSGNGWSAITGATDASYTIDRTTTAMSGNQYRCIVTGNGGETTSSAATLTVRSYEPPYTGKYSYEISTSVGDNGALSVDRYATEGDQVTITVSPDEAYLLDDLTVTSGGKDVALTDNGDGTYTFTMPSGDVAITATFAKDPDWTEPEEPATDVSDIFIDVTPNAWYKDAVQYAYAGGLMTGVSAHEFAPEATTTRAMIVSMLARLEGVESAESAGFADVAADDWYATAVNWAASVGITSGTGDGNFSPNTAITREQLAAILMNYAQYKGQDVSARATLDTYNDATAISSWANDVMSWAVAEGLLTGVTADTLQPQGAATRAQVAAILQRFLCK